MSIFKSISAIAVVVTSVLLGVQWVSAAPPKWGGATTTTQPQPIQQPRKPLVSQPSANTAQTVQAPQSGTWTTPGTTSGTTRSPTVSTPVQQRVSQPRVGGAEPETPMSIAQDECVLSYSVSNPSYYENYTGASSAGAGVFGAPVMPSAEEVAAYQAAVSYDPFLTKYVVLVKGDYQVVYVPELLYIQNLNKNNSVEFLVRLPGINMINEVHADPDDWTKGKKSRITLRPGERVQFDESSGTTLIKVRCP